MGAVAAVSGAGLVSGFVQGQAESQVGKFQKNIADSNANLLDAKARDEIAVGNVDATNHLMRVNQKAGAQRAAFGASGIDPNTGTAKLVQQQTLQMGALDALTIKNNAWKQAWGLKQEAGNQRTEGAYRNNAAQGGAFRTYATAGLDAFKNAYIMTRGGFGDSGDDSDPIGNDNLNVVDQHYSGNK